MRNFFEAIKMYLGNHLFMNYVPHRVRLWYWRRVVGLRIGTDTSIAMGCFITGNKISLGSNTVINRFSYLDGRVRLAIGDNVNISHYSLIQTLTHDPQNRDFVCVEGPVVIEDDVWVGSRVIILPGVTIGRGAVIGAGAVVTKNIAPYAIAVGVPARVVGERTRDLAYKSRYFPYFDTDIQ